jgi:hypothetical protein
MNATRRSDVHVVHAIRGRVRLKSPRLKAQPHLADEIPLKLSAVNGVKAVESNPSTGSVVVHYEPSAAQSMEFLLKLGAAFGLEAADLDPGEIEEWFQLLSNGSSNGATTLAKGVEAVGGLLNRGLSQATAGHLDVKVLLPAVLLFLGFRSLWVSEALAPPKWYEFFWFAFGAYFTLNKPESPGDAAS